MAKHVFVLSAFLLLFFGESSSDFIQDSLKEADINNIVSLNQTNIPWNNILGVLSNLSNFELPNFLSSELDLLKGLNISKECRQAYSFSSSETIFKFFDSSSKISNGLLVGNVFDIGNYDECLNIFQQLDNDLSSIHGKYCLGTFQIPLEFIFSQLQRKTRALAGNYANLGLHYAYCIPSQCSPKDLENILNGFIEILNQNFINRFVVDENYCYTKDSNSSTFSIGANLTLLLLALFSGLVLISTLYDIYLHFSDSIQEANPLLLSFSFLSNGKKIFKASKENGDSILCLNGIKAISMMWVIIAHEYMLMPLCGIDNFSDALKIVTLKANMFIANGTLSVDSFFMVGGLVTMYVFLKAYDKGIKFNVLMFYVHRYLRLTPALVVLIPVHLFLIPLMGNGPFWGGVDVTYVEPCRSNWWAALFYVQNFNNPESNCIPQSWYLSVDMQLFILSPIILLPSVKWPALRNTILLFFISLGIIIPFSVSYYYGLTSNFISIDLSLSHDDYMTKYYVQTHTRFGPYVIGMFFGNLIYTAQKNKNPLNNRLVGVLWPICLAILAGCVYGPADLFTSSEFDKLPHAFVNGCYRNGWAVGLGILIYLCTIGRGGPINAFLSLPVFQVLTKLSYAMYLLHYAALGMRWAASRTVNHLSHFYVMHIFWADFMLLFFMSLIYSLTFESPILVLEKYFLGSSQKKPKIDKDVVNNNTNYLKNKKANTDPIV